MHTISDKELGLYIHYNSDWSGDVYLMYCSPFRPEPHVATHELKVNGYDLLNGRVHTVPTFPEHALFRAVALAASSYIRDSIELAISDAGLPRSEG